MSRLLLSVFSLTLLFFAVCSGVHGEEHESKTLMVLFFDENCHTWCNQVRPIVADLKPKYSDRVDFLEIDVSQNKLKEAKQFAKGYGIHGFIDAVMDYVPEVAIYSKKRRCFTEIVGPKPNSIYEEKLKEALSKEK